MPILLEDKNRDYQRLRHTPEEKAQLSRAGFQHVLSSNVSAIAQDGDDLVIRFHGGATYKYSKKADLYSKMLQSNSKGRFVWQQLIRKNVPYKKVGSVSFKDDDQFTDRDLMLIAQKPQETPLLSTMIATNQLSNLGITMNSNIIDTIIATTALM